MKKLLIIGGTRFIGRNLIEALILHGKYDISLFNRGITNPFLFPSLKKIKGDRFVKKDIEKFCKQDWDCIIDISGYWSVALEQQLAIQTGRIGRYIYISTSSHYQFDPSNPHLLKEDEALVPCSTAQKESKDKGDYNQQKAECERILQQQKQLDFIILRPGLVIGKYDHTDRLYYWLYKAYKQQEIVVANGGKQVISYTNVNDLVRIIVQSIDARNSFTVYNVSSFSASIADFINLAATQLKKEVQLVSASSTFLQEHKIQQWVDLPLWVDGNFLQIDNTRLTKDYNFEYSNIDNTVMDLLTYYSTIKQWEPPALSPSPLSESREIELIAELRDCAKITSLN